MVIGEGSQALAAELKNAESVPNAWQASSTWCDGCWARVVKGAATMGIQAADPQLA
jgi:hypothetical protein